jgi:hypothetical protein
MAPETDVVSFVVRFVCEGRPAAGGVDSPPPATSWHGTIRHVQSDAERRFTRWDDAVAFIAQYIAIAPDPPA